MPVYHRVVLVGVGLLGGSIGLALRERGLAEQIVGVGRSMQTLQHAQQCGAVTEISQNLMEACLDADLVVIGTPVQTIVDFVRQCCTAKLHTDCCVTDVGSIKANICRTLTAPVHQRFCGSHPMAGSEKSGVGSARADLFDGRKTIITPVEGTSPSAVDRIEALWHSLGSEVVRLTPEAHDQAVAKISHLPHVVAAALAATTDLSLLYLIGDGWRDTTRVAGGEVELWRQIISENRQPVLQSLREYVHFLKDWINAIESDDQLRIAELLEQGRRVRDALTEIERFHQ